jgi:hypothetical protein
MAKKPRTLTNEEVFSKVRQKSLDAVGWAQSKLSTERERVTKYLNGEWPKRNSEGSSSYISGDVYDSVEMQRTQLLEVFAGGDMVARFDPDQDMATSDCLVATQYASYVIFRRNEGYNIFSDIIYDGLTARAGVVKVYWEEKYDYSEETFDGIDEATAHGIAARDEVDEFDATQDPETGLYSGSLIIKHDVSKVAIVNIAPEEFLIEPLARTIHEATYCAHRTPKTRAELIEMGYPKKLVMDLPVDDAKELIFSPEVLARTQPTRAAETYDSPISKELDYLVLYESFVRMQIDEKKGVRLYKVCHAGDKLLSDPEEIDKAPFLAYVPLPIPHIFHGNNFAQRVIPVQNARTVLFRGVLDHTAITTNPRYAVVNGGLMNPRELLENRMGGIVNVRRPDSVAPLQAQNLNPYIFQTLQLLTDNNEKSTGISALSQGLNKDAISTQNSKGLIDNMMKVSGGRGKIMARNFANNFLVPLMLEVIRLAILHVKQPEFIEVAGAPLKCNVMDWTERKTCTVSEHLGYGEKDMAAADLTQGYELMAKDPTLQTAFALPQKYAMMKDIAKLKGFNNFQSYLNPNAPPPQPDPLKTQELQIKDKSATANLIQAQGSQVKEQRLQKLDGANVQLKQQDQVIRAMDHDRTHDRQDAEVSARIMTADRELELQKELAKLKMANDAAKIKPRP